MKNWKTVLALVLLVFAVLFEWNWFWAVFITLGLINMIRSKKVHFVEEITKEESPKLYNTMIIIWSILAIHSVLNHLGILI